MRLLGAPRHRPLVFTLAILLCAAPLALTGQTRPAKPAATAPASTEWPALTLEEVLKGGKDALRVGRPVTAPAGRASLAHPYNRVTARGANDTWLEAWTSPEGTLLLLGLTPTDPFATAEQGAAWLAANRITPQPTPDVSIPAMQRGRNAGPFTLGFHATQRADVFVGYRDGIVHGLYRAGGRNTGPAVVARTLQVHEAAERARPGTPLHRLDQAERIWTNRRAAWETPSPDRYIHRAEIYVQMREASRFHLAAQDLDPGLHALHKLAYDGLLADLSAAHASASPFGRYVIGPYLDRRTLSSRLDNNPTNFTKALAAIAKTDAAVGWAEAKRAMAGAYTHANAPEYAAALAAAVDRALPGLHPAYAELERDALRHPTLPLAHFEKMRETIAACLALPDIDARLAFVRANRRLKLDPAIPGAVVWPGPYLALLNEVKKNLAVRRDELRERGAVASALVLDAALIADGFSAPSPVTLSEAETASYPGQKAAAVFAARFDPTFDPELPGPHTQVAGRLRQLPWFERPLTALFSLRPASLADQHEAAIRHSTPPERFVVKREAAAYRLELAPPPDSPDRASYAISLRAGTESTIAASETLSLLAPSTRAAELRQGLSAMREDFESTRAEHERKGAEIERRLRELNGEIDRFNVDERSGGISRETANKRRAELQLASKEVEELKRVHGLNAAEQNKKIEEYNRRLREAHVAELEDRAAVYAEHHARIDAVLADWYARRLARHETALREVGQLSPAEIAGELAAARWLLGLPGGKDPGYPRPKLTKEFSAERAEQLTSAATRQPSVGEAANRLVEAWMEWRTHESADATATRMTEAINHFARRFDHRALLNAAHRLSNDERKRIEQTVEPKNRTTR
ncbi:MAG: hypothetical protein MUE42_05550 [Opitutaceae bacterium]|nr:hypothetical protein [Opitutaceae bacterium]